MNDYNDTPISVLEVLERFTINEVKHEQTGFVRHLQLADTNLGKTYSGRLYWDSNDGYSMWWDGDKPEGTDRPEFEYVLDSICERSVFGPEWLEAIMMNDGRKKVKNA